MSVSVVAHGLYEGTTTLTNPYSPELGDMFCVIAVAIGGSPVVPSSWTALEAFQTSPAGVDGTGSFYYALVTDVSSAEAWTVSSPVSGDYASALWIQIRSTTGQANMGFNGGVATTGSSGAFTLATPTATNAGDLVLVAVNAAYNSGALDTSPGMEAPYQSPGVTDLVYDSSGFGTLDYFVASSSGAQAVPTGDFGSVMYNSTVYYNTSAGTQVVVITDAAPPSAPTLTSPTNGLYVDATTGVSFSATYNSTDQASANARAMRLKLSTASSYSYYSTSAGAFQSTIVWNPVNIAPGASAQFGPIDSLTNQGATNWSMADQESLANLQGPFASDNTVNLQAAPSVSINSPVGSETGSSAPPLLYTASPTSGATITGGQWVLYPLSVTQESGL
jgi:hypothetical protein